MSLTVIGCENFETEPVDFHTLAAMRNVLQTIRHQTAHGFAILVFQMNVEELIELIQIRLGLHSPAFVIHRGNVVLAQIDVVEFVGNLAHDLFNDVFNRDQA